jgi:hypothetical protein
MTHVDSTTTFSAEWQLLCLDRVMMTGHLPIDTPGGLVAFLHSKDLRLEDWPALAESQSAELVEFAEQLASKCGRPYRYLNSAQRKEDLVERIEREDPVAEGLIAVFCAVEPCRTFRLVRTKENKLRVDKVRRKCRHLYFYWQDAEFGRLLVRVQTWYPFVTQILWNGHAWLSRALTRERIPFTAKDNALTELGNPKRAQKLANRLFTRNWVPFLTTMARRFNPLLRGFLAELTPYWVAEQTEVSLDVCWTDQAALDRFEDEILPRALCTYSPEDLARIVGMRRPTGFRGAIKSDYRQRRGGFRIKHWVKTNVIKAYRKGPRLLRVEFTFNHAADFHVYRRSPRAPDKPAKIYALRKGVADFFRYRKIGAGIVHRYLDALLHIAVPARPLHELAPLAKRKKAHDRSYRALNPVAPTDYDLIRAVLNGEQVVHGFRNTDIRRQLFGPDPRDPAIRKLRAARVSRLLALLREHHLIARVSRSHRWRLSKEGLRLLPTVAQLTGGTRPRLEGAA